MITAYAIVCLKWAVKRLNKNVHNQHEFGGPFFYSIARVAKEKGYDDDVYGVTSVSVA